MTDTPQEPKPEKTAKPSLNIYQRVNEVRKKIDYVKKDKMVDTGKGKYAAVTHDAVTAMVRQHMVEFGVVMVPTLLSSELMAPDNIEAKQRRYVAKYQFDFVNIDDPQDRIPVVIEAHGMDNSDKAPGKAISYASKYAMLKLFSIETGEDEEGRNPAPETISAEQVTQLLDLGKEVGADMAAFRKRIRVEHIEDLPAAMFPAAMALLEDKRKSRAELKPISNSDLEALCADTVEDGKLAKAGFASKVRAGERSADELITYLSAKHKLNDKQIAVIKSWEPKE